MKYDYAIEMIRNWENVEKNNGGTWEKPHYTPEDYSLLLLNQPTQFRIKHTPRKVPWGPGDVKPGMVFRHKSWKDGWRAPHCVNCDGVNWTSGLQEWNELQEFWTYSLDGINWAKCERDEVVKS